MASRRFRSFADPDTEFKLIKSDTPVNVDGHKLGEPTGEVRCAVCGRVAGAPEYIAHEPTCSQKDVVSEYYAETHPQAVALIMDSLTEHHD